MPLRQITAAQLAQLQEQTQELMRRNRRTTDGHLYTVPAPVSYPYQWLWDSCFHAIILSHFDLAAAKQELLSAVFHQLPNGLLPHMTYWEKGDVINIKWGLEKTSSITQPPLIAQAVAQVFRRDPDEEFLRKIYPALYHFYKYLLNERDPHGHGLVGLINPDESGEDDSPRFDADLGLPPKQTIEDNFQQRLKLIEQNQSCNFDAPFCMRNFFWVKDVPFNAILMLNLKVLAELAEKIDYKEDALYFNRASLKIGASMRERMLEDGLFWSTSGQDYKKIKVKTWAILAPLIAGMLSKEEAGALVRDHFHNSKEFAARFALPTVAMDEASFDPNGFWRGPVWMAPNWFLYHGLRSYGFKQEAEAIRQASAALLLQSGFRERFNPLTGEGLGAKDFTWGGLVVDMFAK